MVTPIQWKKCLRKRRELMTDETLKEVHEVELDLLEKFATVCDGLGLMYTLSSGTLLGAVRHKGFIPWDDDIDVSMPREDYEIFVKKANELLPEGYFLQHYTTDKNYHNTFAKLVNCNTTWIPYETKNLDVKHGIGMDVFPIDRISDPKKIDKIARKTFFKLTLKDCYYMDYIKTIKNKRKRMVGYLLHPFVKMFNGKRLIAKIDKFNKGKGVGEWTTGDVMRRNKVMPYSLYEEYADVEFEGKTFKCIKNKEKYLRIVYGDDYMQLPPEEKRVTHLAEVVDCHKPYTEYTK